MKFSALITDASFCPRSHAAGFAFHLDGRFYSQAIPGRTATSQQAEHYAADFALAFAEGLGFTHVFLLSDCQSVHRRFPADHYVPHLDRLLVMADHVRGHTRAMDHASQVQRHCDDLARKRMKEQRRCLTAKTYSTR